MKDIQDNDILLKCKELGIRYFSDNRANNISHIWMYSDPKYSLSLSNLRCYWERDPDELGKKKKKKKKGEATALYPALPIYPVRTQ